MNSTSSSKYPSRYKHVQRFVVEIQVERLMSTVCHRRNTIMRIDGGTFPYRHMVLRVIGRSFRKRNDDNVNNNGSFWNRIVLDELMQITRKITIWCIIINSQRFWRKIFSKRWMGMSFNSCTELRELYQSIHYWIFLIPFP